MKTDVRQIVFALVLLSAWLSPVYGQSKLGRLVLVLTDEVGAVVPAVEIQIDSAQTDVSQKTISDANGEAVLRGLPFGAYTISISDKRFELIRQNLLVNSEVSQYLRFQLRIRRLASELTVSSQAPLVDPLKTSGSLYLGEDQILKRVSTLPNRDSIAMVASLPGWVLESNGVLHPRGSEYQTQYVVDGVPIFDNRSPGFASAPLIESADSLEVITAGIPAEFGRKLGGVINLVPRARRDQTRGELQVQGGNQSVLGMMARLSGQRKNLGYSGLLSASHTSRYLDPPSVENWHNQANLASGYLKLDYAAGSDNFFRILAWANGTHLQVPNEVFQQQAGQAQTRRNRDENLTLGWDHYYSRRATSSLEFYRRHASSELKQRIFR